MGQRQGNQSGGGNRRGGGEVEVTIRTGLVLCSLWRGLLYDAYLLYSKYLLFTEYSVRCRYLLNSKQGDFANA